MTYSYKATRKFWKNYSSLSETKKKLVKEKYKLFKADLFHPALKSHSIAKLSAEAKHTIYSAVIEGDLRVIFRIDGSVVTTLTIVTHELYK